MRTVLFVRDDDIESGTNGNRDVLEADAPKMGRGNAGAPGRVQAGLAIAGNPPRKADQRLPSAFASNAFTVGKNWNHRRHV